jgi:hypothetical protein
MFRILLALIALPLAGQMRQNSIELIPRTDNSAAGYLDFKDLRPSAYRTRLYGATGLAGNLDFTLPAAQPTVNGQCIIGLTSGVWSWDTCGADRLVGDYDWSQTLGTLSAPGTVTVTFTGSSCPAAATDTQYVARIYELTTPTTYSLHTQNGAGTCTRGGAGTLIFTSVSGSYTTAVITSASSGWQEAVFSVADGQHVRARAAIGSYHIYSSILTEDRAVLFECDSIGAGIMPRVDNLKVINSASPTGLRVKNCNFTNAYGVANATAIYANNPDGSNYGGLIEGNWFSSFEKSIHAATISGWVISKNHFLNSTSSTAAIHVENLTNGDQGVGLIHGNIFTCGATCTYGLLWNGPGALQLKANNFNGYTTQVHLQPKYGTASASGSTVTWQSGNKFRSILAGQTIYLGSTAAVIASVDSNTQITTASPIGTIATTDYYVNITSQLQISSNNFDSGVNTTKGIRWEGPVQFQNGQIEHNFFSNWSGVSNLEAISIASSGANFLSIRGNNIQSPQATTGTYGIRLSGGSTVSITDNQIIGSKTAIAVESGASAVTLTGNTFRYNDTAQVTSAVSDTVLQDQITVTYADLAGLTVANSSRVYCSDCKQSTTACAGSGSGSVATRINSTWQCQDQTSGYQPWTVSGSDVYRSGGNVAIGSSPNTSTLLVKGASGAQGSLELKHGTASSSLQLYAESSFSVLGTYTSSPLIFATDSAGRWRFDAAGMFRPESDDTYDIGLTGTRVRGVYSKIIDTARSGGTGDYVLTRKLQLFDNTGSTTGAASWDLNVVMSGAGAFQNSYFYLRDNAGNTVWRADKIASGSPVATTTIYTDLLPDSTANARDLGKTLQRWDEINGASMDLTGAANITGNLSAAVVNATGSPAYRVSGTTVIDASRNLSNIGTGEFSGLITASAGVAFGASSTFASDAAYDFGTSSNKLRRLYATGWTIYGSAFAASGSTITLQSGSTFVDARCSTNGNVLTSDGSGNITCQAPAASSLPVADTTNIIKGSADATKLLRFEVDGFTTATTRTLTPQNNSYTIAGTDIAQTFTQTQTFNGSTALVLNGNITGDLLFTSANVYIVGNGTNYLNNVHSSTFTAYGQIKPASGVTTVDLGGSTVPFRKLWIGDISFTGTMTPPSGSAFTGTKTVRASGGVSDCTLTFSAGIMTGGTC